LYQKCLKACDEWKKSHAEIYNRPERTKEETERLRAQGKEKLWEETAKQYINYFEKSLEYNKAYAAFYFWIEYRAYNNSDIESVASKTLNDKGRYHHRKLIEWQLTAGFLPADQTNHFQSITVVVLILDVIIIQSSKKYYFVNVVHLMLTNIVRGGQSL
jgi:hypothetical protein